MIRGRKEQYPDEETPFDPAKPIEVSFGVYSHPTLKAVLVSGPFNTLPDLPIGATFQVTVTGRTEEATVRD